MIELFRAKVKTLPLDEDNDVTPEEAEEIRQKLINSFTERHEKYLEAQVLVYDQMLSDEAVDGSLVWYTSDAGQEVINAMPHIQEELHMLGGEFCKETLMEIMDLLDGPDIDFE